MDLVADRAVFRAGETSIVDGISLTCPAGSLVAIVGPNGAGKTTLLRLLGGDLTPTDGGVTIGDRSVSDITPTELAVTRALMTEGPSDIPLPAVAVVALGRIPHRRSADNSAARDSEVVDSTMRRVGVSHLASRIYASLSKGEQALTSLARTLAQDTPIVLLDEPTAALDVAHQENVMRLLVEQARRGRSVVAVAHDLNLAARYSDRIVVIGEGQLAAEGPPPEVLTSELLSTVYRHPMKVIDHPLRGGPLVLVDD